MIKQIGNILISKVGTLPFVDKYAGVVKTLSFVAQEGTKQVKKMFPAACNITLEECSSGRYKDLIPDSSKKSVLYLEDKGLRIVRREGGLIFFKASYDLVCWLNMPKLGFADCSYSGIAITSILAKLPTTPFNNGIYNRIAINVVSQATTQNNPFQKYSYDETINQFLMFPFDYFTLAIEIDFVVNQKCLSVAELNPPLPC